MIRAPLCCRPSLLCSDVGPNPSGVLPSARRVRICIAAQDALDGDVKTLVSGLLALAAAVIALQDAAPVRAQSAFTGEYMPYGAFDGLESVPLSVGGGALDLRFAPGDFVLPRPAIAQWLQTAAKAIAVYYGRFPAASVKVLIVPVAGRGVRGGQAFGYRGSAVRLMVGRESTAADLERDWKAVHEMVHVATPALAQQHLWLTEGLAVYVESIARVQSGDLTDTKIWTDFVRDMPQGLPQSGDRGLDHTATWGRTYWGGAVFCLLADIEMRKRTGNKSGLQDALRRIVAEGGSNERRWPIERLLKVGDAASGQTVLTELYAKYRASADRPDLGALWRDLGVIGGADAQVVFDNTAILSPIRQAITAAPQG